MNARCASDGPPASATIATGGASGAAAKPLAEGVRALSAAEPAPWAGSAATPPADDDLAPATGPARPRPAEDERRGVPAPRRAATAPPIRTTAAATASH